MDLLLAFGASLLGLLIGGVLNILADDLPMRRTPSRPHYPDGTPRTPSAWLGIAAFLTGQREPEEDPGERTEEFGDADALENPEESA